MGGDSENHFSSVRWKKNSNAKWHAIEWEQRLRSAIAYAIWKRVSFWRKLMQAPALADRGPSRSGGMGRVGGAEGDDSSPTPPRAQWHRDNAFLCGHGHWPQAYAIAIAYKITLLFMNSTRFSTPTSNLLNVFQVFRITIAIFSCLSWFPNLLNVFYWMDGRVGGAFNPSIHPSMAMALHHRLFVGLNQPGIVSSPHRDRWAVSSISNLKLGQSGPSHGPCPQKLVSRASVRRMHADAPSCITILLF